MSKLKTGMSSFKIENIPLKFKSYLNKTVLPKVPHPFGHVTSNDVPWDILGNDQYGDCTIAGIAHGDMVWNIATGHTITKFDTKEIVDQYMQLTGGVDSGLDPVDVAQWWQNTGLKDSNGMVHRIRSFTAVENITEAAEAAYLFGFAGLAVWLPDSAQDQFSAGHVWDDTSGPPDPHEGHFIPLVGQNSKGDYMVVTWGRLQGVTKAWLNKYMTGGVAYTSQEYMMSSGLVSPEGFNFTQLDADLASL